VARPTGFMLIESGFYRRDNSIACLFRGELLATLRAAHDAACTAAALPLGRAIAGHILGNQDWRRMWSESRRLTDVRALSCASGTVRTWQHDRKTDGPLRLSSCMRHTSVLISTGRRTPAALVSRRDLRIEVGFGVTRAGFATTHHSSSCRSLRLRCLHLDRLVERFKFNRVKR
jgi:hypothetical protein